MNSKGTAVASCLLSISEFAIDNRFNGSTANGVEQRSLRAPWARFRALPIRGGSSMSPFGCPTRTFLGGNDKLGGVPQRRVLNDAGCARLRDAGDAFAEIRGSCSTRQADRVKREEEPHSALKDRDRQPSLD